MSDIQIYCVGKRVSINPQAMDTDIVEWFFSDARQMVGGLTNKMMATGMNSIRNPVQFTLVRIGYPVICPDLY